MKNILAVLFATTVLMGTSTSLAQQSTRFAPVDCRSVTDAEFAQQLLLFIARGGMYRSPKATNDKCLKQADFKLYRLPTELEDSDMPQAIVFIPNTVEYKAEYRILSIADQLDEETGLPTGDKIATYTVSYFKADKKQQRMIPVRHYDSFRFTKYGNGRESTFPMGCGVLLAGEQQPKVQHVLKECKK